MCPDSGQIFPYVCEEGMVCNDININYPVNSCPEGYYCSRGTCSDDPFEENITFKLFKPLPCPKGMFCPNAIQR